MQSISVLGRDIHFREVGTGRPMILFHGFGGSHLDWDLISTDLAKNYRIVIPTLSTHYLDLKDKLSFEQQVELLGGFLRQIFEKEGCAIVLGGASFGAALAWGLAIQYPEYIDKLVLVSPMPPSPGDRLKDFKVRSVLKIAKYPAAVAAFLMSPLGRMVVPYLENVFQLPWAKSKKRRGYAFLTDRKVKVISHSIARFHWIVHNSNWMYWETRLTNVTHPTLVLWGDHDTLFGESEISKFANMIPNSEFRTVIGGGHAMTRESPGAIVREINHFLKS